jgi:EmrB/QacA subfamily drug resistance transporter
MADHDRKWWIMTAVCIGTFASTVNISIVNISLPAIQTAFNTDVASVEWVVLVFSLTYATLLVTVGRLGDMLGRKRLYVAGACIFALGALLCGLSGSILVLIAARVVQAIGGSLIVANGSAIITDAFPREDLGKALGISGSVVAIGTTVGPSLGGFIVQQASWPWVFFVSVPLGLITAAMAGLVLPKPRMGRPARFDWLGALTLGAALLGILLSITFGQESGWLAPGPLALFVVAAVFGFVFLRIERRAPEPVLDLGLFRHRLFAAALACTFLYFMAVQANTFLMPFLLQQVLGYSAQQSGLLLISVPLAVALIAPVSGLLSDKLGSRQLASLGLAIGGFAFFWLSRLGLASTTLEIVLPLVLLGLGNGVFQAPNNSALMGSVSAEHRGVAGGLLASARHLGVLFGIAVAGAVWVSRSAYYAGGAVPTGEKLPPFALLGGVQDALVVSGLICTGAIALAWMRGPKAVADQAAA